MHIRRLTLRHFRTYEHLELELPAKPVLLLGANAQGKTSLLEAIAYLALGRSPLTHRDHHLIHWDAVESAMPFAHLQAHVVHPQREELLEIALEWRTLSNGNRRTQKQIKIDQRSVRLADLAGHLNVVCFLPEDLTLVTGSPSERRRYLDDLLSQVYATYVEVHSAYRSAVSRRNALLRHMRDHGGSDPLQLVPLEERLVRMGVTVAMYRRRVIRELTMHVNRLHQEMTGDGAWLQLAYQPNFEALRPPDINPETGELPAIEDEAALDVESLYDAYRASFQQHRQEELHRGVTVVGPHRDDFTFMSNGRDVGVFGSRGQQRTAVLALRLAELHWLQKATGETPVLLMDEVLAELDRSRRGYLLNLLEDVEQTILTTTDAELFPSRFRERAAIYRVAGGAVSGMSPDDIAPGAPWD
jgi:DNA replication and repair protein RecF